MKLSKLSMLPALLVVSAYADWKSDLRSDFNSNLKYEFGNGVNAGLKNATQIPLNRKIRFNIRTSDLCSKMPKSLDISVMNESIANAMAVDAVRTAMAFKIDSVASAKNAGSAALDQAAKTYTAEQLVAVMVWFANKVQEKTGITTPATLKPVVENEYVVWLAGAAAKTVARAAADTIINFGINKFNRETPGSASLKESTGKFAPASQQD